MPQMTDSVNEEKGAGCPVDLNVEETDASTKDTGFCLTNCEYHCLNLKVLREHCYSN